MSEHSCVVQERDTRWLSPSRRHSLTVPNPDLCMFSAPWDADFQENHTGRCPWGVNAWAPGMWAGLAWWSLCSACLFRLGVLISCSPKLTCAGEVGMGLLSHSGRCALSLCHPCEAQLATIVPSHSGIREACLELTRSSASFFPPSSRVSELMCMPGTKFRPLNLCFPAPTIS